MYMYILGCWFVLFVFQIQDRDRYDSQIRIRIRIRIRGSAEQTKEEGGRVWGRGWPGWVVGCLTALHLVDLLSLLKSVAFCPRNFDAFAAREVHEVHLAHYDSRLCAGRPGTGVTTGVGVANVSADELDGQYSVAARRPVVEPGRGGGAGCVATRDEFHRLLDACCRCA